MCTIECDAETNFLIDVRTQDFSSYNSAVVLYLRDVPQAMTRIVHLCTSALHGLDYFHKLEPSDVLCVSRLFFVSHYARATAK